MDNLDRYLELALRAQSQSRATWDALATIKNPPVAGYVRQANIAHGPQQVNNTSATPDGTAARERKSKFAKQTIGGDRWRAAGPRNEGHDRPS